MSRSTRKQDSNRGLRKAGTWTVVGGVLAAGAVMCAAPQKEQVEE